VDAHVRAALRNASDDNVRRLLREVQQHRLRVREQEADDG